MTLADHMPHSLDDDALSGYVLHDGPELARVLRGLVDAQAMIGASLVPGNVPCPTTLIEVRDDGTLLIDGSWQDALNRRIETCAHLICETRLDAVQIRFRLRTPVRIAHEGRTAFVAPWPEALMRLQRRELYRVAIPPGAPVTLHAGTRDAPGGDIETGLRVLDMSGTGVAVALADDADPRFAPEQVLDACLLRLPDSDPIPVAVAVAHVRCQQTGSRVRWRAGCRFVDLPPASQRRILQYIFQVERQRNARMRRAV